MPDCDRIRALRVLHGAHMWPIEIEGEWLLSVMSF
jgi:hypothetical protein